MYRLIYFIPIWCLVHLIRVILFVVGLILVPIALLANAYRTEISITKDGNNGNPIMLFTWDIMKPYNNLEDGFYCTAKFNHGFFWTSMRWTCWQNPVNGLRYMDFINTHYDIPNLKWIGSYGSTPASASLYDKKYPHWFLCWQGCRSNLYIQWEMFGKLWRFWIGDAKLYPDAIIKIPEYQKAGVGPVFQLMKEVRR